MRMNLHEKLVKFSGSSKIIKDLQSEKSDLDNEKNGL